MHVKYGFESIYGSAEYAYMIKMNIVPYGLFWYIVDRCLTIAALQGSLCINPHPGNWLIDSPSTRIRLMRCGVALPTATVIL